MLVASCYLSEKKYYLPVSFRNNIVILGVFIEEEFITN